MNFTQSFVLALKGLATSKMRAFLTMLGIIIGVGAVIVIMSLGNGMQQTMVDAFESMGTNSLTVTLTGRGSTRNMTVEEMYEFYQENSEIFSYMSPTVSVSGTVRVQKNSFYPTMTGAGEEYLDIKTWNLSQGRMIQYIDIEAKKKVCVVGAYYNSEEVYDGNALGNTLKINGDKYTIVGVVEEISDATDDSSGDNMLLLPYSTAAKMSRMGQINSFTFVVRDENYTENAKELIEQRLYKEYGDENSYSVMSMAEMLDTLTDLTDTLITVLACIAGISLLVGGIGIMNIMLVSVTERTREIGIRKALGAKKRDIKWQFVIEAGTTSAIGGVIGIFLGSAIAKFAGEMISMTAVTTVQSIALSFGISVGIGILFGFLPANKAANLNPIDALRYD